MTGAGKLEKDCYRRREKRRARILRNNRFALVICGIDGLASPLAPFICILNTISQTLLSCEWRVDESRQKKRQKTEDTRKKGNGALSQATPDKSAFLRFYFLRLIERCFDNHLKTRAKAILSFWQTDF